MARRGSGFTGLLVVLCLGLGCDPESSHLPPGETSFASADPTWVGEGNDHWMHCGEADADGDSDVDDVGLDLGRALAEADIVTITDDRLYALSDYFGLVIVDVSDPDDLRLLGRFPAIGDPFEMTVRDGIVYAIFADIWDYETDADGVEGWTRTGQVIALDVSDPGRIRQLGAFEYLGAVSDSRIVGDVLYLVAYEDGTCPGCAETPQTSITAISIVSPSRLHLADRLIFEDQSGAGSTQAVLVTPERLYVAGPSVGASTIRVVDISDPGGQLELGAEVQLSGLVESRWQMDEHLGVLRVISQPSSNFVVPRVETFEVVSSSEVRPLGSVDIALPRPERLMSARFDDDRAYAITFEVQTGDPLYLIDLSDPADPRQRGELEMPGWVEHLEPRGDLLFGLGFSDNGGRRVSISLFDVSDLDSPVMLDTVDVSTGVMVEDQDRLHKAFQIDLDGGLIFLPFQGLARDSSLPESGVQIVRVSEGRLVPRGVAEHRGMARRSLLHRDRLLTMSDERVEAFDLSDLGAPERTSSVLIARDVRLVAPHGDGEHLVELVRDPTTFSPGLEVLPLDDPNATEPVGAIDLGRIVPPDREESPFDVFDDRHDWISIEGDQLVFVWRDSRRCTDLHECWLERAGVAVIDISDPELPELLGHRRYGFGVFPTRPLWRHPSWNEAPGLSGAIVRSGSTLVLRNARIRDGDGEVLVSLEVIDLSDPSELAVIGSFVLPGGVEMGALALRGDRLFTSHREPLSAEGEALVRYYLDEIDLSEPSSPSLVASINIPGRPLWLDERGERLVTIDDQRIWFLPTDWEECYATSYGDQWEFDLGLCRRVERSLTLVDLAGDVATLRDRFSFNDSLLGEVQVTPTRVFAWATHRTGSRCDRWSGNTSEVITGYELVALTGPEQGELLDLPGASFERASPFSVEQAPYTLLAARGEQAVLTGTAPSAYEVLESAEPPTWPLRRQRFGEVHHLVFDGDRVITANGLQGVQILELNP